MSAVRPSQRLAVILRMTAGGLDASARALWTHPHLARVFPEYQQRLYHVARATLSLIEAARERARLLAPECAVAAQLVPYLTRHLREERNHDEWLLGDLAVLGISREAVLARRAPGEVATLIGPLYYWVLHTHPVALLAYFYLAEGHPMSREFLDEAVARTGLPKPSLRWFYRHAVLDVKHGADVTDLLDSLPLREEHLALLGMATVTLVEQMTVFLDRLVQLADGIGDAAPPGLAAAETPVIS